MSLVCHKDYQLVVTTSPPLPTAYWALEEVAGSRINAVGDPNGDLGLGGPDPGGVAGIIGNGLLFILPFEVFASPNALLFNYNTAGPGITWAFWFQANPFGFPLDVRFYLSAWDLVFLIQVTDLSVQAQLQGLTLNSTATINQVWVPGQWYFVSAQFRGSNGKARISVDAGAWTEAAGIADIAGATTTPSQVLFGGIAVGPVNNIVLDEVGIFVNQILTDAQVAFLYNGGIGRTYPF